MLRRDRLSLKQIEPLVRQWRGAASIRDRRGNSPRCSGGGGLRPADSNGHIYKNARLRDPPRCAYRVEGAGVDIGLP
ncbi:MAG: hypothetical protein OXH09_17720 [Gammaproteobacteria bacterium]|nr:hypothetical protein [Gammaproteobacteria bacterium]